VGFGLVNRFIDNLYSRHGITSKSLWLFLLPKMYAVLAHYYKLDENPVFYPSRNVESILLVIYKVGVFLHFNT
jgi:hypothetical protein